MNEEIANSKAVKPIDEVIKVGVWHVTPKPIRKSWHL